VDGHTGFMVDAPTSCLECAGQGDAELISFG
jgi:hypothetical protein